MILIGITGYKRSGKDSVARVLASVFGFEPRGFADALRTMAAEINPTITLEGAPESIIQVLKLNAEARVTHFRTARYNTLIEVLGYDQAKAIPDLRRFLQRLGTEGVRGTFGPNAWVDALDRSISADHQSDLDTCAIAVCDVRFASEAAWIQRRGGIIWRVSRPGVGGNDPHPSEKEIPYLPSTRTIQNDSTLDALERVVIDAVHQDFPALLRP